MNEILNKQYRVTMPDGSKWDVPVFVIARNRAEKYAREFGGDVEKSLTEDTIPLFESDDFEIQYWAQSNMDWSDVKSRAVRAFVDESPVDYEEGWRNGATEIV